MPVSGVTVDVGFSGVAVAVSLPGVNVAVGLSGFTRAGSVLLPPGEDNPSAAVIDVSSGFAYFGTTDSPGVVAKLSPWHVFPVNFPLCDPAPANLPWLSTIHYQLSTLNEPQT